MGRGGSEGFVVEQHDDGRTLVVTGPWTTAAERAIRGGEVDSVWLNYARGYSEPDLSFVDGWPIKHLHIIDRTITDLAPLERLAGTLEGLSIQVAPSATLDLSWLPRLQSLAGYWSLVEDTIDQPEYLGSLIVFDYDEADLTALTVQPALQSVRLKNAPNLETLEGAGALPTLTLLAVGLAPRLTSIDAITAVSATLRRFELEGCRAVYDLAPVGALVELRFLSLSDCGEFASFGPLAKLAQLECLYAWGSTHVNDLDLSPLLGLERLTEIRMRDRRSYVPTLASVKTRLGVE